MPPFTECPLCGAAVDVQAVPFLFYCWPCAERVYQPYTTTPTTTPTRRKKKK